MYTQSTEAVRKFVMDYTERNAVKNPLKPIRTPTVMPINPQSKLAQAWGVNSVLVLPIEVKKGSTPAGFIFSQDTDLGVLQKFALDLNLDVKGVKEQIPPELEKLTCDPLFVLSLNKGVLEDMVLFNVDLLQKALSGLAVTLFEMKGWQREMAKNKVYFHSELRVELPDIDHETWEEMCEGERDNIKYIPYVEEKGGFSLEVTMRDHKKTFEVDTLTDLIALEKEFHKGNALQSGMNIPWLSYEPEVVPSRVVRPIQTIYFDVEQGVCMSSDTPDCMVSVFKENLLALGEHSGDLLKEFLANLAVSVSTKIAAQNIGQYQIDLSRDVCIPCEGKALSAFVDKVVDAVAENYAAHTKTRDTANKFRYFFWYENTLSRGMANILNMFLSETELLQGYSKYLESVLNILHGYSMPLHLETVKTTSLGTTLLGYVEQHKEVLKDLVATGMLQNVPYVQTTMKEKECAFRTIDVTELYRFVVQSIIVRETLIS